MIILYRMTLTRFKLFVSLAVASALGSIVLFSRCFLAVETQRGILIRAISGECPDIIMIIK